MLAKTSVKTHFAFDNLHLPVRKIASFERTLVLVSAQCWQGRILATGKTMWAWSETERNEGTTIENYNTHLWVILHIFLTNVDFSCFSDSSQMFLFNSGRWTQDFLADCCRNTDYDEFLQAAATPMNESYVVKGCHGCVFELVQHGLQFFASKSMSIQWWALYDRNGVMKLYITNSHSFLEIAGTNNYTRVAFFLRLAQTFFRFHDPTAGLPNLGRLPLFDKQTALVIVDMQRDCQCVFSSDESGTEILHILGKYEKVCQLLDTAQFFLTTCEHTHTHTPPSSSSSSSASSSSSSCSSTHMYAYILIFNI